MDSTRGTEASWGCCNSWCTKMDLNSVQRMYISICILIPFGITKVKWNRSPWSHYKLYNQENDGFSICECRDQSELQELQAEIDELSKPQNQEKRRAQLVASVHQNSMWWKRLTLKRSERGLVRTKLENPTSLNWVSVSWPIVVLVLVDDASGDEVREREWYGGDWEWTWREVATRGGLGVIRLLLHVRWATSGFEEGFCVTELETGKDTTV